MRFVPETIFNLTIPNSLRVRARVFGAFLPRFTQFGVQ